MVTFADAAAELYRRVDALCGAFGSLYPGVPAPKAFDGFPVNEPPFYIAVDDVIDTAEASGAATNGAGRLDFTVHVMCFARHSDRRVCSGALLSYVDAVFKAVMADQRLRMSVDTCFPSVEAAGISADNSKRYMAAASVGVRCTVFSKCPRQVMEVIG